MRQKMQQKYSQKKREELTGESKFLDSGRVTEQTKNPNRTAKSIFLVMAGTLCSRLLGFARNATIAFYFGAGAKADVLNFIQAIPLLLRRLAAEGSLETALVPELSRSRVRDPGLGESKALWRKLLTIQWSIILPLCLLLVLFPKQIVDLLTEFPSPEQTEMAARMLYLVSPYILLLSQSVLFGALLSSQQRFTLSSFAPLLTSVSVIALTMLLQARYSVFAVLFGMLCGIFLQVTLLMPAVLRSGYSIFPGFWGFCALDPAIRRIMQVWLPLWLSTSLLALMQFVANYLASQALSGSLSALTNALIFFQLPQGLIYASIAKVCLPRMSLEKESSSRMLCYGLKQLLILMLPATLVLFLMSDSLIAVAFQRGAFTLQDSLRTAEVLRYYILGSLPVAMFRFLQQYLYAQLHKVQPLLQTALLALLDIPLSIWFMYALRMGVIALPLANTLSYLAVSLYAYCICGRKNQVLFAARRWAGLLLRILPKLLAVCAVLWLQDLLLRRLEQHFFSAASFASNSLQLAPPNLDEAQLWWWSSGASLQNFGILAAHGLSLLASFVGLCRLLGLPLLCC